MMHLAMCTSSGQSLFATLERLSDGYYWSVTAAAWQANPAAADRKISLAEGTAANLCSYTASVAALGDAGEVRIRIHDDADANDKSIAVATVYVVGGNETFAPVVDSSGRVQVQVGTAAGQINSSTGKVPATVAVGDLAANSLTAAALAADAVTEIQNGLAMAAALATVDDYLDTEIAAIKAKTDLIGSASATVSQPVSTTGTVNLIVGDDYYSADSRALEWTDSGSTWPDLTGATVAFRVFAAASSATVQVEHAGTVIVASGAGKQVRVELPNSKTDDLVEGVTKYEVVATLGSGHKVTLSRGVCRVTGE